MVQQAYAMFEGIFVVYAACVNRGLRTTAVVNEHMLTADCLIAVYDALTEAEEIAMINVALQDAS